MRLSATLYVHYLPCVHGLSPSSHLPRYSLLLIHTKANEFLQRNVPGYLSGWRLFTGRTVQGSNPSEGEILKYGIPVVGLKYTVM